MNFRTARGLAAYIVPTFALGFVWHLILFKDYYDALAMYRHDVIIPFGLLSMAIQGLLFAIVYERLVQSMARGALARGLLYGAFGVALSWSFTTIAVAAKNVMTSVPAYLAIETAFTLTQWAMVAPLTIWVYSLRRSDSAMPA